MAFLSAFYPQPVVKGTTAGTYAEGNDSRITGAIQSGGAAGGGLSGTYPNPTLANITPTGASSQHSRSIQNRFADSINVLDYGADPTGTNDSWLAIQRAIYDSGFAPENRIAITIGASDTIINGNRTFNKLQRHGAFGAYKVLIPAGNYKISKPLSVIQGTYISGSNAGNGTRIILDNVTNGQFTGFVDIGILAMSDESATEPWTFYDFSFNHGTVIENLSISPNYSGNQQGLIVPEYYWMKWPWNSFAYATVSGSAGSTELTSSYGSNYFRESKIKLYPSNQILDVQWAAENKIYLKNPLANAVNGETYAIGFPKHNGILISGGEGSRISNVSCNQMLGSGIHIFSGSPSPIIENCMCSFCDTAYTIETFPAVILKPSGDGNNCLISCKGYTTTTVFAGKFEDARPTSGLYTFNPNLFVPYPNLSFVRSMIEIEGIPSGSPSYLSIDGLTLNAGNAGNINKSFVDVYTRSLSPVIQLNGIRAFGWGKIWARHLQYSGIVSRLFPQDGSLTRDEPRTWYSGTSPYYASQRENFNGGLTALTLAGYSAGSQNVFKNGITLDVQNSSTNSFSGEMPNRVNFNRDGTVVTVTYRNAANDANEGHGLRVGDMVYFGNYSFSSGSGNLAWNNNPNDGDFAPVFTVKTVSTTTVTNDTFTITVANSGATAGSADIGALQYTEFHTILRDEHRFQIPNTIGNGDADHRAFSILDRKKDVVASLIVPAVDKGTWWIKEQFAAGGTVGNPAIRIIHGTGAPSASAPNGSIYLRTDGDPSSTVYVRAGNVWRSLGAYEP